MRIWLVVVIILILILYIPIPYKIYGPPILTNKPCFIIFNHPMPYVDVSFADKFLRKQNFSKSVYILVKYPHSIAHSVYILPLSGATNTLPVKGRGTTLKMIERIEHGHTVAAFYTKMQTGYGIFWAILETQVPCFTVRIDKNTFHIERLFYDRDTSVDDLRNIVRSRFGYERFYPHAKLREGGMKGT